MRQYHNLGGWLRDVQALLDDPSLYAAEHRRQLNQVLDTLVSGLGWQPLDGDEDDGDMEDADDSDELAEELIDDGDAPVAVRQPGVSSRARTERRLVGASSAGVVGAAALVASQLPPGVPSTRRQSGRRASAVAAAGKRGVKRGKK